MSDNESEVECVYLKEFREYLNDVSTEAGCGGDESTKSSVAIVTRASNDSYPLTVDELPGEIKTTIWNHLHAKRCPPFFRLGLQRAAARIAEAECRNAKECQCVVSASNGKSKEGKVVDTSATDGIQYDLIKLQKFTVNVVEKLLTRLTDNAEAGNLKHYAQLGTLCDGKKCQCAGDAATTRKSSISINSSTKTVGITWPHSVAGFIKNKPRKMEDRHICLDHYSDMFALPAPYSFYGVFDGHSGPLAACYTAAQLPHLLAQRLQPLSIGEGEDSSGDRVSSFCEALEAAFQQTDVQFTRKGLTSGSTAVCALLALAPPTPRLYVAWVGDSKALLVSPHASLQLVKAHKPDGVDERKRIESSGGAVLFVQGQWRVNGILNVSRSIGDSSVNAVIAEPDFVDVPLMASHDFLVLGTDGLWDHVAEADVVAAVYQALADVELAVEEIPRLLIDMAKRNDSQDNITAIVVLLKKRARIVEHYESA